MRAEIRTKRISAIDECCLESPKNCVHLNRNHVEGLGLENDRTHIGGRMNIQSALCGRWHWLLQQLKNTARIFHRVFSWRLLESAEKVVVVQVISGCITKNCLEKIHTLLKDGGAPSWSTWANVHISAPTLPSQLVVRDPGCIHISAPALPSQLFVRDPGWFGGDLTEACGRERRRGGQVRANGASDRRPLGW